MSFDSFDLRLLLDCRLRLEAYKSRQDWTHARSTLHNLCVHLHPKAERRAGGRAKCGRPDAERAAAQGQCGARRAVRRRRGARTEPRGLLAVLRAQRTQRPRCEPGFRTQPARWPRGPQLRAVRSAWCCRRRHRFAFFASELTFATGCSLRPASLITDISHIVEMKLAVRQAFGFYCRLLLV